MRATSWQAHVFAVGFLWMYAELPVIPNTEEQADLAIGMEELGCPLSVLEGARVQSMYGTNSVAVCIQVLKEGSNVIGVVVKEEDGMISLDTKPCEGHIKGISQPKKKTVIGSATCRGTTFELVLVES